MSIAKFFFFKIIECNEKYGCIFHKNDSKMKFEVKL